VRVVYSIDRSYCPVLSYCTLSFFSKEFFFSDVGIVLVNNLVGDIVYVEDEIRFLTNNLKNLKNSKKKYLLSVHHLFYSKRIVLFKVAKDLQRKQ